MFYVYSRMAVRQRSRLRPRYHGLLELDELLYEQMRLESRGVDCYAKTLAESARMVEHRAAVSPKRRKQLTQKPFRGPNAAPSTSQPLFSIPRKKKPKSMAKVITQRYLQQKRTSSYASSTLNDKRVGNDCSLH